MQTIDVAKNLGADTIELNIATPWPDTKFYSIAKANGWLLSEDYTTYNEKIGGIINSPFLPPEKIFEAKELFKSELKKAGYIHWGTDCTVMVKPKSLKAVLQLALKRMIHLQVTKADFRIFKDWLVARTNGFKPTSVVHDVQNPFVLSHA